MNVTGRILAGAVSLVLMGAFGAAGQPARADSESNFKAADANRNGTLNRREFRVFIDKEAADGTGHAPMIQSLGMYNDAFDMVDANGDGQFSVNEVPPPPAENADENTR